LQLEPLNVMIGVKNMKIESEILRGFSVSILFIIYLTLWKLKRKEIVIKEGIDPEVLSKDNRPSQRFFASFSKIMTVALIVLLIFQVHPTKAYFVS